MNIEIRNGNLWIERNGVMREQICPFATVEMGIFPVCGERCPQFEVKPENGRVYICHDRALVGIVKRVDQ